MPITRTRTKYYVLSVLGALAVAVGVLALAPSAQAQTDGECAPVEGGQFCIDKTVSPNPVSVGEPLTFTILLSNESQTTQVFVILGDTLPPGVEFVSVTPEQDCTHTGAINHVECVFVIFPGETQEVTIEVIPRECGTFTNTATAALFADAPQDTEEFTVVGCEGAGGSGAGGSGAGGGATPITQEGAQESEAGEIDQSFDVS